GPPLSMIYPRRMGKLSCLCWFSQMRCEKAEPRHEAPCPPPREPWGRIPIRQGHECPRFDSEGLGLCGEQRGEAVAILTACRAAPQAPPHARDRALVGGAAAAHLPP